MATKRKYKERISEAIHSSASGLFEIGVIDKATMREFDESCLSVPAPIGTEGDQEDSLEK